MTDRELIQEIMENFMTNDKHLLTIIQALTEKVLEVEKKVDMLMELHRLSEEEIN